MNTIVMIMAGGKGSRLGPLTCHRAKPAMPFGGRYRIVDFVLSNFVNSGYRKIYVLTQYMASSLIKHLNRNWHLSGINEFIEEVPAQMRMGTHWYQGTADAVFQNLNLVRDAQPRCVAVFGGDHIYKIDVAHMEAFHHSKAAVLTIAAFPVPRAEASAFGVIQVDEDGRIIGFQEKPDDPTPIPGNPDMCLVSMGNYIFDAGVLQRALIEDATDANSSHDFGRDVIPALVRSGEPVFVYDFAGHKVRGEPPEAHAYWRDVGTIDSWFHANMELRSPLPTINLYNRQWRVRTAQRDYPPARFVTHHGGAQVAMHDSLVCGGAIIQSARLNEAVVGYDCFVHAGATLDNVILLSGCDVGEGAELRRVICDKNCRIAPGATIGVDPESDVRRFPFRTPSGIVVLPKGTYVPAEGPIEFAYDIAELMVTDPATRDTMTMFEGRYSTSSRDRHSNTSMGPRYRGRGVSNSLAEDWTTE